MHLPLIATTSICIVIGLVTATPTSATPAAFNGGREFGPSLLNERFAGYLPEDGDVPRGTSPSLGGLLVQFSFIGDLSVPDGADATQNWIDDDLFLNPDWPP
jgi:hypothetical protein